MIAPTSTAARPLVLHVRVVCGHGGGPEKTIFNSPRYLRPLGYDAACAYMHPPDDPGFRELQRTAAAADAELISIPDRGAWDWSVVGRLTELCRQRNVAIWHGHDYKSNLLGLWVRQHWPMSLVTTVHGWIAQTWRSRLYNQIDRMCLRRYDRVICVSEDLLQAAIAAGAAPARCVLIENAIDLDVWRRSRSRESARAALGLSSGRFVVGAAGRLSPEKGFDLLIRSVAKRIQLGSDVELVVAGDGAERNALERLARELGCGDRVRWLGYVADLRTFYESLDAFVLSSRREGLPNVLLEAMALEVPVAATRIAGVPRVVQHESDGLLVDPNHVESLAAALARLEMHLRLREQLAARARATIEQRYSFRARMQKVAEVYDAVPAAVVRGSAAAANPQEALSC